MKLLTHLMIPATLLVAACGGDEGVPHPLDGAARGPGDVAAEAAEAAAAADLRTIVMTVPSMSCSLCVRSIRVRLEEAGLRGIDVDLATKRVQARFDPDRLTASDVEALVESQGFAVQDSRVFDVVTNGGAP